MTGNEGPIEYYNGPTNNDQWIVKVFRGGKTGFFVEAGALDGIHGSCTYTLERFFGWRGILIEPGESFPALKENRPKSICVNVCLSDKKGPVLFADSSRSGYSGIKEKLIREEAEHEKRWGQPKDEWKSSGYSERWVESISLPELLERCHAPRTIDYLALDIEGSEYDALTSFPFEVYKVMALTIEGSSCDELLLARGYRPAKNEFNTEAPWERYFLHPDFAHHLSRGRRV